MGWRRGGGGGGLAGGTTGAAASRCERTPTPPVHRQGKHRRVRTGAATRTRMERAQRGFVTHWRGAHGDADARRAARVWQLVPTVTPPTPPAWHVPEDRRACVQPQPAGARRVTHRQARTTMRKSGGHVSGSLYSKLRGSRPAGGCWGGSMPSWRARTTSARHGGVPVYISHSCVGRGDGTWGFSRRCQGGEGAWRRAGGVGMRTGGWRWARGCGQRAGTPRAHECCTRAVPHACMHASGPAARPPTSTPSEKRSASLDIIPAISTCGAGGAGWQECVRVGFGEGWVSKACVWWPEHGAVCRAGLAPAPQAL